MENLEFNVRSRLDQRFLEKALGRKITTEQATAFFEQLEQYVADNAEDMFETYVDEENT